jgi:hypothetical protein
MDDADAQALLQKEIGGGQGRHYQASESPEVYATYSPTGSVHLITSTKVSNATVLGAVSREQ